MQSNNDLVFELQNLIGQFKRNMMSDYSQSKLKGAEKHILFLIYDFKTDQAITVSQIAGKMGVTLAAVTHQINTLEKYGFVKRLPDHTDRRLVLITLTKKGQVQVGELKREFKRKIQILARFLGEDDTRDLVRIIKKMTSFTGFNQNKHA